LYGRQCDASLGPKPGDYYLFAASPLNRGDKVLVVPRVHRRSFDRVLLWKHSVNLRPHIAAEGFGFDGGKHDGNTKHLRCLRQYEIVIDDRLSVEVTHSKQHLRLEIYQCNHAV